MPGSISTTFQTLSLNPSGSPIRQILSVLLVVVYRRGNKEVGDLTGITQSIRGEAGFLTKAFD